MPIRLEQTARILDQAFRSLAAGDVSAAETALRPLLEQQPEQPDGLFLMGLVRESQGRAAEAESFFRRTLNAKPEQPDAQVRLAFTLFSQGRLDESLKAFNQALRIAPNSAGAHFGAAQVLQALGRLKEAESFYRNALRHRPDLVEASQKLASVLSDLGRPGEAEAILLQALPLAADDRQKNLVEYTLGVVKAQQARHEEALSHFDRAKALAPNQIATDHNRATMLQYLGRDEEAVAIFRAIVRAEPLNFTAHHHLNYLLYRMGRDGEFLSSYDAAMAEKSVSRTPAYQDLAAAKAGFLLQADRALEARDAYRHVLSKNPAHRVAQIGLAAALEKTGEFEAAADVCQAALKHFPDDSNLNGRLAVALLSLGEPGRAAPAAAKAVAADPANQMFQAIQGLVWRMAGDGRDEALNGYDTLIRVFDLEPPEGYSDMIAFNRDLDAVVKELHPAGRGYVDQPLRGGTQSIGHLFQSRLDLVGRLRKRIEEAVGRYIAELPADSAHPLSGRRGKNFAFSGSWSSRLGEAGFLVNHVHPRGWISSAYYVEVPKTADTEGWIKFGEPSYDLALSQPVRRLIQPKPGRLILFPSYVWHGTVPFNAPAHRTSISFDVLPS